MEVLFVTAEMVPFSKVGGLADVAGALPKALAAAGHHISVATPMHTPEPPSEAKLAAGHVPLRLDGRDIECRLYKVALEKNLDVYLVDLPAYFHGRKVYGEENDLERFTAFSLAALQVPATSGRRPDVVHAQDWHTALAPWAVKHNVGGLGEASTLFTVHNMQYQGHVDPQWFRRVMERPMPEEPSFQSVGLYPSMMGLAVITSEGVSTVSPTYAKEITTPEQSFGMHPLLAARGDQVYGIINGIDYDLWDPARDTALPQKFDAKTVEKRAANKAALQERLNLPKRPDVPVMGVVNRLADQKGIDILLPALEKLLPRHQVQLALLGTGDKKFEEWFKALAARMPQQVAVVIAFDDKVARTIYGGSDIFLMPSRFEPCGLGQMIAMRYGSIPIGRKTGGLADTIDDCDPQLSKGTGFLFEGYSPEPLEAVMERALTGFAQPRVWKALQQRAMARDFSWGASAKSYESVYNELKRRKKASAHA